MLTVLLRGQWGPSLNPAALSNEAGQARLLGKALICATFDTRHYRGLVIGPQALTLLS